MPKEKPKYNMFQNSAYMISLAWNNRKSVLGLGVASALLAVAVNLIALYVTPAVLAAIESSESLGGLIAIILAFTGALIAVHALKQYVGTNTIYGRIELRSNIVGQIHSKYNNTSYPNTDAQDMQKKLETANMAVNSNDQAAEAIWETLVDIMSGVIGFIIYLFLLMNIDPVIMLVVLATSVVGFFVNKRLNGWEYRHRDEQAEYIKRMSYIVNKAEDHTLAKDLRIFGMRGWLEDMYSGTFRLYKSFVLRGEKVYIWTNVADVVLTFIRNGAAYIYLIGMVMAGGLSAPEFLLYFSAIGGFAEWVSGILSKLETLSKQSLGISTVREFIEYPEIFKFEDGEPLPPDLSRAYEIELRDVTFRYPGAEINTLEHIELKIPAGEKLAVVGLNGAGKTTLVKLICGFYDPTEGEVLLNGVDIRRYNRRDYYRHFSAVFQDFSILPTSIADNITQGGEVVDADRLDDCVQNAGMAEKVAGLPCGYDTNIGKEVYEDGLELSGGETQRLMLARALYKNAPIIVLDEPTAALDPIAESDLYNKYSDLTGGRTSVYISHRLASTRFCDRIILIDGSRIAEEGTHDTLIGRGGKYAELFGIQSQYYSEGSVENEIE